MRHELCTDTPPRHSVASQPWPANPISPRKDYHPCHASDPSRLFGIAVPIIQAPMAGVSTPELAAAVSNAGGLGSIGIGASSVPAAQRMIEETRARTSRPFNVNVFCHRAAKRDAAAKHLGRLTSPRSSRNSARATYRVEGNHKSFGDDEDMFRMLLATRPPIISFHFGLPGAERLAAFRDAGICTMATATNPQGGADPGWHRHHRGAGHRGGRPPGPVRDRSARRGAQHLGAGEHPDQARPHPSHRGRRHHGRAGITAALTWGGGRSDGDGVHPLLGSAADAAYRAALESERAYRHAADVRHLRLTGPWLGQPPDARRHRVRVSGHSRLSGRIRRGQGSACCSFRQRKQRLRGAMGRPGCALARERPAAKLVEELIGEMLCERHELFADTLTNLACINDA